MRRPLLSALAALPFAAAFLAGPVHTQEWRPGPDDHSISFALPDGGGSGPAFWWHRDGGARGIELRLAGSGTLDVDGDYPDRYAFSGFASVGPAFKWYREPTGPVSPYFYTGFGVQGRWGKSDVDDPNYVQQTFWSLGPYARLGLGVDWFPLERVSVGGYAGARANYEYTDAAGASFVGGRASPDRHQFGFDLFTSSLTFHIYF